MLVYNCAPQDMSESLPCRRNGSPDFILRSDDIPKDVWILAHENNKYGVVKSSIVHRRCSVAGMSPFVIAV